MSAKRTHRMTKGKGGTGIVHPYKSDLCGKLFYESKSQAKSYMKKFKITARVYKCADCDGYHVSSINDATPRIKVSSRSLSRAINNN